jgi:hypothetical protein
MTTHSAAEQETTPDPSKPVKPVVQYAGRNCHEAVAPLPGAAPSTAQDYRGLPLILKEPAMVRMGDKAYRVEREGWYRFFDIAHRDMRQTHLFRGDVWLLAGSLSRMHVHGWRGQDKLPMAEMVERARTGGLTITCGTTGLFVSVQLREVGIQSRFACTLTFDEWNDYDNGHSLVEIFDPAEKRWICYDSDLGCRLRYAGRWLDLGEACRLCREGKTLEADYPAGRCTIDPHGDNVLPADARFYSLLFESVFKQDAARDAWYRRVFQLPVIEKTFPSDNESDTSRARVYNNGNYAKVQLSWAEWRARFYGGPGEHAL